MKLLIDHSKIKNSPYKDYSNKQDKILIEQLENQFLYGNPSCFLISGYRGVGKSSLICKVENKLKDQTNIIFAHINFYKYTSYTFILRYLIREIYFQLSNEANIKKFKELEVADQLELLYERTFTDVNSSSGIKVIKSFDVVMSFSSNLKKILIAIIVTITTSINFQMKLIPKIPSVFNVILILGSIIWAGIETITLTKEIAKKTSTYQETSRKSLYDDEIAEYHIIKILTELKEHYKIIFVLDELDKIENQDVETIICQLKPIMLSDLASFVIISGQMLLYKLSNSNTVDDSSISSMFSRLIHVPLLNNESFTSIFKSIVGDDIDLTTPLMKFYIDSFILNSNRTIRRFLNLICQDILWENEKAYLSVDEEAIEMFKTDHILLTMISQIINENVEKYKYIEGIKDFFIIQLHLWVQKVKLKSGLSFTKEEIFNFEKDYSSAYPYWCASVLNHICEIMLESMVEVGLLEIKTEIGGMGKITYYKWENTVKLKIEDTLMNTEQIKTQLTLNTIDLDQQLRDLFLYIFKDRHDGLISLNIEGVIKRLVEYGILDAVWQKNETIELVNLSSKLTKGEPIGENSFYLFHESQFEMRKLMSKLLEGYSYYIVKHYLGEHHYDVKHIGNITKTSTTGRFIAESNIAKNIDIIFDIKYKVSVSSNDNNIITLLIQTLIKHNKETGKNNALVMIWYCFDDTVESELFYNTFNRILFSDYPDLKKFIYFLKLSDRNLSFNFTKIKECIDIILYD